MFQATNTLQAVVCLPSKKERNKCADGTCGKCGACRQRKYRQSPQGCAAAQRRNACKRDATRLRRAKRNRGRSMSFDGRYDGQPCDSIGQPRPKGYLEKLVSKIYGPDCGFGPEETPKLTQEEAQEEETYKMLKLKKYYREATQGGTP